MHGPRNPWQSSAQTQGQSQQKNGNQPILGELGLHTEESPFKNGEKMLCCFYFLCQSSHLYYTRLNAIIKIMMDQTSLQPFGW